MDRPHIGHYEVRERLGGSRAEVHRAVDHRSGRTVVLKGAPWHRPAVTAALAREAAILRRVSHPSLVRLVDVVEDLDGRTLVLANGAGGDLTRLLAQQGALDPAGAADLGARLAGALAVLHDVAVVHRDVRPSNVVVDAELVPVLCDLDHALDPSQPGLATDTDVVGDAAHVDPRLFDGLPQGPGMDLFGLGSVVWAAATGGRPRPTDLAEVAGSMPPSLLAAIDACLAGTIGDARAAAAVFAAAASDALAWRPAVADPAVARTATGQVGDPWSVRGAAGGTPSPPAPTGDGSHVVHVVDGPPAATVREDALPTWRDADRDRQDRHVAPGAVARPQRVAALAGGGAGGSRPTRRWQVPTAAGPGPRTPGAADTAGRRRRLVAVAVGIGVGIGVAAVLTAFLWARPWSGDRAPAVAVPSPTPSPTASSNEPGSAASEAASPGAAVVPVVPPLPCAGTEAATSDDHVVRADLTGAGCSVALRFDDGVLTTPDGGFAFGQPGDQLVAGDWDGDGGWSPGLYRPATGELFLFDAAPSVDGGSTSRPAEQREPDGTAVVVADPTAPSPRHAVAVVGTR